MEKPPFNAEAAAFRTELIGNILIDHTSPESKRLLGEWIEQNDRLEAAGLLDRFSRAREEAEVYLEAEAYEAALFVMKAALVQAIQENKPEEGAYFIKRLEDLGEDPDDLSEIQ